MQMREEMVFHTNHPPNYDSWDDFWKAEAERVKERGPVPAGGCKNWWCCATWWGVEFMNGAKEGSPQAQDALLKRDEEDLRLFGVFLSDFMGRHSNWFGDRRMV